MGSVSIWLIGLRTGDPAAYNALVARYDRGRRGWLRQARARLVPGGLNVTDDLAQHTFFALWREVAAGRQLVAGLTDRLSFVKLLSLLARQSGRRLRRYDLRAKRRPARLAVDAPELLAREPGPAELAAADDTRRHITRRLSVRQQAMLDLRAEGYDYLEIAARLGCCKRTVYREVLAARSTAADAVPGWHSAADDGQ